MDETDPAGDTSIAEICGLAGTHRSIQLLYLHHVLASQVSLLVVGPWKKTGIRQRDIVRPSHEVAIGLAV